MCATQKSTLTVAIFVKRSRQWACLAAGTLSNDPVPTWPEDQVRPIFIAPSLRSWICLLRRRNKEDQTSSAMILPRRLQLGFRTVASRTSVGAKNEFTASATRLTSAYQDWSARLFERRLFCGPASCTSATSLDMTAQGPEKKNFPGMEMTPEASSANKIASSARHPADPTPLRETSGRCQFTAPAS